MQDAQIVVKVKPSIELSDRAIANLEKFFTKLFREQPELFLEQEKRKGA